MDRHGDDTYSQGASAPDKASTVKPILAPILILSLATAISAPSISAQGKVHWATSLANALAEARDKNTIVMIAINMPGERGSDMMQPVYANDAVAKLSKQTVNLLFSVSPDASTSEDERTVRERYLGLKPEAWAIAPNHIFIDPAGEGKLLSSVTHAIRAGQLEWMLADAIKKVRPDFKTQLSGTARAPGNLLYGRADARGTEPPSSEQVAEALAEIKKTKRGVSRHKDHFDMILRSPEKEAIKFVEVTLRSRSSRAQRTLLKIGSLSPSCWWKLIVPYSSHKDPEVRAAAATALGQLGEKKALKSIAKQCKKEKDDTAFKQQIIAMAVLCPKNRGVVATIKKVLTKSKSEQRRIAATISAGIIAERIVSTELLRLALSDSSGNVRSAAAYSIATRRDQDFLPTLEAAIKKERSSTTKALLEAAVAVIQGGERKAFRTFIREHVL